MNSSGWARLAARWVTEPTTVAVKSTPFDVSIAKAQKAGLTPSSRLSAFSIRYFAPPADRRACVKDDAHHSREPGGVAALVLGWSAACRVKVNQVRHRHDSCLHEISLTERNRTRWVVGGTVSSAGCVAEERQPPTPAERIFYRYLAPLTLRLGRAAASGLPHAEILSEPRAALQFSIRPPEVSIPVPAKAPQP